MNNRKESDRMAKDTNNISSDILKVSIFVVLIVILVYFFKIDVSGIDFNRLSTTFLEVFVSLLGFIITAITILFMFDNEKSERLKKLKYAGYYNQILERFISTTIVLFFGIILFTLLSFIEIGHLTFVKYAVDFVVFFILCLVIVRIYRSINILHLIYKLAN